MRLTDFSDHRIEVFALYDKKEDDVKDYIRILRDWMIKLPHLPNDMIHDDFLEICLLKNKFSIEKCKMKIEMYCTLKSNPHYSYVHERIPMPTKEASFYTPLPMLTENLKRVMICKIYDIEAYEMAPDLNCNAIMREILLRYDYNDGEIIVLDMRNCPASIIKKLRLNVLADGIELILKGCSCRLSEIHVVSKVGKTIFSTVIPLLPKKLASRLQFHEDADSLRNSIPAKYLPKDLGGDLKSLEEINEDWKTIYEENLELLNMFRNTKSREELRIKHGSVKEEMNGTFRKLNID